MRRDGARTQRHTPGPHLGVVGRQHQRGLRPDEHPSDSARHLSRLIQPGLRADESVGDSPAGAAQRGQHEPVIANVNPAEPSSGAGDLVRPCRYARSFGPAQACVRRG